MRRSTLLLVIFFLALVPAIALAVEPPGGRINTGPAIEGPVPPTIPPQFDHRALRPRLVHRSQRDAGLPDRTYINLSGQHGDWMHLHNIGLGNRWGIIMNILSDCGPVSVEPASWGAVKALWR